LESTPQNARAEISGYVLAGGLSSRLGQDKVLLPWRGQTLLGHAIGRLQRICGAVRVCADRKDLGLYLPRSEPLIHDALAGTGPLAGIVAGLEHSQTPWNFFLAVDLPLVPVELLQALAARVQSSHVASAGTLCILPQVDELPQPLCGLYHRSLMDGLRGALEEGKYKIMLALRDAVLRVEGLPVPLVGLEARQGPALGTPASRVEFFDAQAFAIMATTDSALSSSDWFLNINTQRDWQLANQLGSV
jgi:molybdopterin-guanine dinucleotide biosynthesis protein A